MALFIANKLNATETKFSYRYLRLLQLCQNADHGDKLSSLLFPAIRDNKIHCLIVLFYKAKKFFKNYLLGFSVCFCS